MARIHRRSPGTWEVVLEVGYEAATGRRERRTFTVRGTKKEAEAAAAAQVAALTGGTFVDPSKETVEEFLHRWLRDYVEPSLALRTQQRYREVVEYDLLPFIGKVPLQKLRPAHVIALEQRLRASGNRRTGAGLGPAAVQKVHSVLHRAMAHAVRWQALAVNPVSAVDRPAVPRVEVQMLTPEQARQLLRALRGVPDELALRVALLCGLRLSELLALRWGDVYLERGGLVVRQALDLPAADGSPRFKETKTHRAERPVSLPDQLVEDLREHRRRQVEWRLAAPAWVEL
ncbi:MAG: site-specific integrase, partial [Candidatus Dormibacteria bacterium]